MLSGHLSRRLRIALLLAVACIFTGSCMSLENGREADYVGPMPAGGARPIAKPGEVAPVTPPEGQLPAPPPVRATPPIVPPTGPLSVSVQGAVLMAVENNRAFAVERLTPAIRRTAEEQEKAVFDPLLTGGVSYQRTRAATVSPGGPPTISTIDLLSADLGLTQFFPSGTLLSVGASVLLEDSPQMSDSFQSPRLGVSVTQSLLRGYGAGVNLASLRQAKIDTRISQYELRGLAEALVAQVEETYWGYALAGRQIEIYAESLKLAEQQLAETRERINVGKLADIELAAAEAEVALRREGLINARSAVATARLNILRLLNPGSTDLWNREVVLENQPFVPDVKLEDVQAHVDVALRLRADLNQARLAVQRGDLEIVKTRNGLLPRLDLFITLGRSGYANSFGRSVASLFTDRPDGGYDVLVGLAGELPIGNRGPTAAHERAVLSRKQAAEAVANFVQLVQVDVRAAYIEVNRAAEQVTATAATRKHQEEKARAEEEKFRVGKISSLLVAQAQRDLLASQIDEVQAVVNYLVALVELHRLDGSLLERRGILAPGREPAEMPPVTPN